MTSRVSAYGVLGVLTLALVGLATDQKPAPKDFDRKFLSKVPHHHQGAPSRICWKF